MDLYFIVATSKPGMGNWVMNVCTAIFNAFTSGLALTAMSKSLSNLPVIIKLWRDVISHYRKKERKKETNGNIKKMKNNKTRTLGQGLVSYNMEQRQGLVG